MESDHRRVKVAKAFQALCGIFLVAGLSAIGVGGYFANASGESQRVYIVTNSSLKTYIPLGIFMLLTALLGIFASLSPLKRKRFLQVYIGLCSLLMFIMGIISIVLWVRTLNIDDLNGNMWRDIWSSQLKRSFEDDNTCCGYLNPKDSPEPSSKSCNNSNINYGCMLPVLFYTQIRLRGVYAGLVVYMLLALAATMSGTLLLVFTNDLERVLWAQSNYLLSKRPAQPSVLSSGPDSPQSSLCEQPVPNNGWDNDD
ncbi:hypothetical protein EV174_001799 [Coemansia sp. RSA 2320]|nr:hypothetical protein EV174_001799 [Coemansia sp. RSA 2320]